MFTDRDQHRFWAKVDQEEPDECWMWQGFCNPAGYGTFSVKGKMIMAHRYSLGLKLGRPVEHPMMACHTCDNPGCVNPSHLWEGTRSDNVRDAMKKGRAKITCPHPSTHVHGSAHPSARLNNDVVTAIRQSTELSTVLAKRYGVTKQTIRNVQLRRTWRHVQ